MTEEEKAKAEAEAEAKAKEEAEAKAKAEAEAKAKEEAEAKAKEEKGKVEKLVTDIKTGYEAKIAKINSEHAKEIAERDAVITQLLTGDDGANTSNNSIVDNINKVRDAQLKKW